MEHGGGEKIYKKEKKLPFPLPASHKRMKPLCKMSFFICVYDTNISTNTDYA